MPYFMVAVTVCKIAAPNVRLYLVFISPDFRHWGINQPEQSTSLDMLNVCRLLTGWPAGHGLLNWSIKGSHDIVL